jgi:hypothetical protein
MIVFPVKLFAVPSTSVPLPALIRFPAPSTSPLVENVWPAATSTVPLPLSEIVRLAAKLFVIARLPPLEPNAMPALAPPRFASTDTDTAPALIVRMPVNVFTPPRTSEPVPAFVMLTPPRLELIVAVRLGSTVIVPAASVRSPAVSV